jgi:hypothetical protein
MTIEMMMVKIGDSFMPATDYDKEISKSIKQGKAFSVSMVSNSARSLAHHKLYFGGLVRLVSDYWESDKGLISKYDKQVMSGLIGYVSDQGVDTLAISTLINLYLNHRSEKIKARLSEIENTISIYDQIHSWLKEETGYYDVILTPTGTRKELKSINFNAMSREDFNLFYKKAFSVAWNYVLSKNNFESQEQAESIAIEMSSMG